MIKIIADSTCDIGATLAHRYDIDILPLNIILDDKSVLDGEMSQAELFKWADDNAKTPKTAALALDVAVELLSKYKDDDIIAFTISSEMSTSHNVMRIAAEEAGCRSIRVIDSRNLSTGIGLLVLHAADMAGEGATIDEIAESLNELIPRVRASFVIDTLTYLQRGGRCSPLTAMAANLLSLKPMIVVENGVMGVSKKYRGKISRVIEGYVNDLEPALRHADKRRVFITHTLQGDTLHIADDVATKLRAMDIFDEVHITTAGGVISSHCGPGTLGVLFIDSGAAE